MINAHKLCLSFGEQTIFDNISFMFNESDRIGLVGNNGAGKSTLLKVIAGRQELDSGSVVIAKDKTFAYLPQDVVVTSNKTILEETLEAFATLTRLQKRIAELEPRAHAGDVDALEEYAHIQMELADYNPDLMQSEAEKVLMGLGFKQEQFNDSVQSLSVGWRMRIVLAKLLLQKADFYLFDEPTNHLDIMAKEWFINFLKRAPFGFMIVSHERYLLNQLCTTILELELGNGKLYFGNYDEYRKQKEQDLILLEAAYKQQQKEIEQKKRTINRFRASASKAKMAQAMLKDLDRMDKIVLPQSIKEVNFNFPAPQRAGKIVLTVEKVSYAFGKKEIFKDVSFHINRGEKVALVAANGVGKTTLFNVIIGKYPLQSGHITFGHNVEPTIFDQDQSVVLDHNATILENVQNRVSHKTEQQIRTLLGSFLFSNDDVYKKVKVLSGGEKNRVAMVIVLLQDANFLLLDEPTNHLDIPSKEILLKALLNYQGTIFFVSHDHDFVNTLATRILELSPQGVRSYLGNFEDYLYQKGLQESPKQVIQKQYSNKKHTSDKELSILQKESKKLERKIAKVESQITTIELSFADLEYGTEKFTQAQQTLERLKEELDSLMNEWESIESKK